MTKLHQITKFKYLNDVQLFELKQSIELSNTRDSLIVRLLLETGMRGSELCNTTTQCLDLNDLNQATIFIQATKGSKDREVPLQAQTAYLLSQYLLKENLQPNDKLFDVKERMLRNIWAKFKPKGSKGVHSLRHTFAIKLFEKFRDIKLVQTALGHRSITSTMVYADFVYSKNELNKLKDVI